jgi:NAD(P)-dependent dehydrogenase (short-subunit alcohol dehydrogenase family)
VRAGPTRSEGAEKFIAQMREKSGVDAATFEKQFFDSVRPTSLLKRFSTIEEVANMIVYLASPLASSTTGAALRVDGGVVKAIL